MGQVDFVPPAEAGELARLRKLYADSGEDQAAEVLWLIPDLRDVLLPIALLLPLIVGETTIVTVDRRQVVPLKDALTFVLDSLFLHRDVHRGDSINFLHQLDQVDSAKVDQLVDRRYDILVSS